MKFTDVLLLCISFLGQYYFRCTVCTKDLQCGEDGVTAVKRHCTRKKHRQLASSLAQASDNLFQAAKKASTLRRKISEAEIKIALFHIEHNASIQNVDHLVELIKSLDPDSKVLKGISCGRTKCSAIMKNVIGKFSFNKLVEILRQQKFSLMVDESTDIGTIKHLVLCVRYLDPENRDVRDDFLALLRVGEYDLVKYSRVFSLRIR